MTLLESAPPPAFISFNAARAYQPELGLLLAVDAAHHIGRPLPAAALASVAPPGGLYQDVPSPGDVRVTLDYDLSAPLAAPRCGGALAGPRAALLGTVSPGRLSGGFSFAATFRAPAAARPAAARGQRAGHYATPPPGPQPRRQPRP